MTGDGGEMSDNEVDFSLFVQREFPTRFFAKGNTIFKEGEQGDEFFVVVRGEVEIRSGNRRFETVGQNGIFGEMATIDDSARSATVVALTDVAVAPIQEQQFLFMVKHTPFIALRVMRVLANRLRRQNKAAA
jgi:CRP/FNR family transcriptional regulator, cyclic AMP receptor protein